VHGAALSQVWLFILAPLVGGALAALVYRFLYAEIELVPLTEHVEI
jgi:aquaporin Z